MGKVYAYGVHGVCAPLHVGMWAHVEVHVWRTKLLSGSFAYSALFTTQVLLFEPKVVWSAGLAPVLPWSFFCLLVTAITSRPSGPPSIPIGSGHQSC